MAPLLTMAWLLLATAVPLHAALPCEGGEVGEGGDLSVQHPTEPVLLGEWFDVVVSGDLSDGSYLEVPELPDGMRVRLQAPKLIDGLRVLTLGVSLGREGSSILEGLEVVSPDGRQALPALDLQAEVDLALGDVPRVAGFLEPVRIPLSAVDPMPFLVVLLVSLIVIGVWTVRVGRVIIPVVVPESPDLLATRALAALRSRIPRLGADIPPFIDAVSDVLRTYIEQRFEVKAPEHTTEEFLQEVLRQPALADRRETLAPFLELCDLVKFARHRPGLDQVNDLLVTAERFVEDTRDEGQSGHDSEAGQGDVGAAA